MSHIRSCVTARAKLEDIDQRRTPSHPSYHIDEEKEQEHSACSLLEHSSSSDIRITYLSYT
jgi:hypothetical protein